jgi:hypothetical protein
MHNQLLDENKLRESDWYTIQFSEEDVKKAKAIRASKDRNQWGNRFESETRWVGYLGEIAFRCWLNEVGFGYRHYDLRDEKDIRDFTVGLLEIDVKTLVQKKYPQMYYNCEVNESQLDNDMVNAYVFCRYMIDSNEVIVLGWIPKKDFLKRSWERKKGDTLAGGAIVTADMQQVKVSYLKPLIDIDRYR